MEEDYESGLFKAWPWLQAIALWSSKQRHLAEAAQWLYHLLTCSVSMAIAI